LRSTRFHLVTITWAMLGAGCASTPAGAPSADTVADTRRAELACTLPTQCVDSLGGGSFSPLRYVGEPAQATAALLATLATFPEARVVRNEGLQLEVIFTTPIGFRDQVDFRIDPAAQHIDYRSRSLFGLFDFGKNRSRMREFIARFDSSGPR
jgi:uncharacterized protein (DUF1499 family)